jgi:hypothetical protein
MADPKKKTAHMPPTFTREELAIINNALNEVCNGLSFQEEEFQTRLGFSREHARKLLGKVANALKG